MKKTILLSMVVIFVLALGAVCYAQGMGPGMMGHGYDSPRHSDWNYCPYCGSYIAPGYGMGPGMMGRNYGMGHPGMVRRGYMGPGMMGYGYTDPGMMGHGWRWPEYDPRYDPGYRAREYELPVPLDEEQAKDMLENYLQSTRNPNLKLGKVEDKGDSFEAEIQTKDGSLVDKIIVYKNTGWMRSAY